MENTGQHRYEFTLTALGLAVALSLVMGAANVYLGLRAGMTVSASIPAAVIAMGVLRGVLGRRSALEANLAQTGASAGESLAAGIIFTMPALVLTGIWEHFDYWTTTLIAFSGGLLGVLFMIPMRRVFVLESPELKYPEGLACAEVLRAGAGPDAEGRAESDASLVFKGLGVGAFFKFCGSYLGLFKNSVEAAVYRGNNVFFFGMDISPVLVGVGVIVGLPIASQIFLGGAIGWLGLIPFYMTADPSSGPAAGEAWRLWSEQVRYVGVGAMIVGGAASIWRVRKGLLYAARELGGIFKGNAAIAEGQGGENIGNKAVLTLAALCVALIAGLYYYLLHGETGIAALVTVIMIVMAFFFTAVASYIVGLVGNSNSPVSGMTITTVLVTGGLVYWFGYEGTNAIVATLGVAGIVCCVACTSGDVCNDLKTGALVGASPRYQQIMQIIGVFVAAFIMAPVLTVLHEGSLNSGTGGIGGRELPAPQATLFASLANGFFGDGSLPWDMVAIGVGTGALILLADAALGLAGSSYRLHAMPVAVGIYLPLGLSVPILMGGLIHFAFSLRGPERAEWSAKRGVLVASGIIAGESLMGVASGFLAFAEIPSHAFGERLGEWGFGALSAAAFLAVMAWMYAISVRGRGAA